MTPTKLTDRPQRVLIVDDEQYVRESLVRDLQKHFTCLAVEDGESARLVLEKDPDIDIVLVDESLGLGKSGLAFLQVCQRQYPFIVRCLISGRMEIDTITKALGQGLYHRFFFKPWDPDFLVFQMKECTILAQALRESKLDSLTGLLNRRAFDEQLQKEIERGARHHRKLCLTLWDMDLFKQINDQKGHPVGDDVLKSFADLLVKGLRSIDYVARIGGDEFAAILPDTGSFHADQVCNRIRDNVLLKLGTSVSVGIAEFNPLQDDMKSFLTRADQLLYKAKKAGRNQVQVQD